MTPGRLPRAFKEESTWRADSCPWWCIPLCAIGRNPAFCKQKDFFPGKPNGQAMQNRIAEWRVKRGLSQRQLAKLLFVNHSDISRWESGTHEPRVSIALEMARLFGCRVEDLFSL